MVEYLATNSNLSLEEFCGRLQAMLKIPLFSFDSEDGDPYAWVDLPHLRINVSRPTKPETLQVWMPSTPPGSTFQIFLLVAKDAPSEWTHAWARGKWMSKFVAAVESMTGCPVTHYATVKR